MTPEEFFGNAIKKTIGSIREAEKGFHCILYARIHKIHREHGWAYLACKKCGRIAKEADAVGINLWNCKIHKGITARLILDISTLKEKQIDDWLPITCLKESERCC